jgi:tetratricopeptide (TPR) repeat protein
MDTSMCYIKYTFLLLLSVLIYGCAQEIQQDNTPGSQGRSSTEHQQKDITTSEAEFSRYKQAIYYISNNDMDKAQTILLEFTQQRPELAGPWTNLGLIKLKQNDFDTAEKFISIALEKNPELAQALNLMATIRIHQGKIKVAEQLYKKSIALKPSYSLAHYNLALLYDIYLQNIPEAIVHYTAYLELSKENDSATRDWLKQLKSTQTKG